MFDMNGMMGKVQEAQKKLKEAQESLSNITAEGEAGAGMVAAIVNGNKRVLKIEIDESLLSKEDKNMVQDLTVAAINKALENIEPKIKETMKNATNGVLPDIPGFDINNLMKNL